MKKIQVTQIFQGTEPGSDFDITVSTGQAWAVFYQGQCIQIRKSHRYKDFKKYLPTSSTQSGTAKRMARKLNELFGTSDFEARPIKP